MHGRGLRTKYVVVPSIQHQQIEAALLGAVRLSKSIFLTFLLAEIHSPVKEKVTTDNRQIQQLAGAGEI